MPSVESPSVSAAPMAVVYSPPRQGCETGPATAGRSRPPAMRPPRARPMNRRMSAATSQTASPGPHEPLTRADCPTLEGYQATGERSDGDGDAGRDSCRGVQMQPAGAGWVGHVDRWSQGSLIRDESRLGAQGQVLDARCPRDREIRQAGWGRLSRPAAPRSSPTPANGILPPSDPSSGASSPWSGVCGATGAATCRGDQSPSA